MCFKEIKSVLKRIVLEISILKELHFFITLHLFAYDCILSFLRRMLLFMLVAAMGTKVKPISDCESIMAEMMNIMNEPIEHIDFTGLLLPAGRLGTVEVASTDCLIVTGHKGNELFDVKFLSHVPDPPSWMCWKQSNCVHPLLYEYALHVAISAISRSKIINSPWFYNPPSTTRTIAYMITDHGGEPISAFFQRLRLLGNENGNDIMYLRKIVEVAKKIILLLEESHRLGVIHGNIKTATIYIDSADNLVFVDLHASLLTCGAKKSQSFAFKTDALGLMEVLVKLVCDNQIPLNNDAPFENNWVSPHAYRCLRHYVVSGIFVERMVDSFTKMHNYVQTAAGKTFDFAPLLIWLGDISKNIDDLEFYISVHELSLSHIV